MLHIVDVDSVVIGASWARELGLGRGSCRAVMAWRTIVAQEVGHGLIRAVVFGRAKLHTVERVDALERVEIASWSWGRISRSLRTIVASRTGQTL